jgi:hypothetical protein
MINIERIFGWTVLLAVCSMLTIPVQAEKTKTTKVKQTGGTGVMVDIYQDMASGNPGDLLTPALMNASSHGGVNGIDGTWELMLSNPPDSADGMWVSTNFARQLPGIVTVNGINYNSTGTHTWRWRDKYEYNSAVIKFGNLPRIEPYPPYYNRMTVACYYTPGQNKAFWNYHDIISIGCNPATQGFAVLDINYIGGVGPYIYAHAELADGTSTGSPTQIKIVSGKTYWVNLHHDGPSGKCYVAVFDPDNGFAQVGNTVVAESTVGSQVYSRIRFGRCDAHGDNKATLDDTNQSYINHILIDYTNAAFPLLPDLGNSQEISLSPGWNWISFNVLPADLSLNSFFSGIFDKVMQVKAQTQSAIRSSGNWEGDLADMNGIGQYKMYKVKVSQACTLTVTGTAFLSATPISLTGGWNWVAYLPTTAMPIATSLASISGQVQEVKSLTQSATYNGTIWSGTLTQLEPGQGYAIKISAPGTLIYPGGQ